MDVHATVKHYITELYQKATAPLTRDSLGGMQDTVQHLAGVLDQASQVLHGKLSLEGDLWPEADNHD